MEINVDFIGDTYKYSKVKTDDGIIFYHKDVCGVPDAGKVHEVSISNHPMMIMADKRKLDLLQHPLCLAIILRKWRLYGRWPYYFQLAYYLLQLSPHTSSQVLHQFKTLSCSTAQPFSMPIPLLI